MPLANSTFKPMEQAELVPCITYHGQLIIYNNYEDEF